MYLIKRDWPLFFIGILVLLLGLIPNVLFPGVPGGGFHLPPWSFLLGGGMLLFGLVSEILLGKNLRRLKTQIEKLRQIAGLEVSHRLPLPDEAAHFATDERCVEIERQLRQYGLVILGDRAEVLPDGTVSGVARWFVDETRTVCGWFAKSLTPVAVLFSESSTGHFSVTIIAPTKVSLIRPPNIHALYCDWNDGFANMLERHRFGARGETFGRDEGLRRFESMDDCLAMSSRLHDCSVTWRMAQDPRILLERDIECVLGDRFKSFKPALLAMMQSR